MSRFAFAPPPLVASLALAAICAPLVSAQTAADLNEGLSLQLVPGTPGAYDVGWWARAGRTYFLQRSTDLTSPWEYFPLVETGQDAVVRYGFTSESPRVFVRLRIVDQSYADPYALDSDGDGLTNQQEFDARTDPFSNDTDGDGMPDKWEIDHGLDPLDPADALADANGNGISNVDEHREGTDPTLDFYQGVAPVLIAIDGADQARRPGEFLPRPLRVRVTHPDGNPWAGAPVRFTATADEGLLSVDTSGANGLHPALTVNADADGYAQVWLKCP